MKINLLLTPELNASKPDSIKVSANFGRITVVFPDDDNDTMHCPTGHTMTGDNAVIEGDDDEIVKWLKPFDGFAVGVGGSPQFEQFEIRHISKNL